MDNAEWDHTKVEVLGRGEDRGVAKVMQGSLKKTAAMTLMRPIQGRDAEEADGEWVPVWDTVADVGWAKDVDGEPAEKSRVAGWVPGAMECPRNGQTDTAVVEWDLTRAAAGGPAADEVALKAMRDKKAHRKNRKNRNKKNNQ